MMEGRIEAFDRMVDVVFCSVMEKFYYSNLRRLVVKFVDKGFVLSLFAEGRYNMRMDIINDLLRSGVIHWLKTTDIVRAKEVPGRMGCIQGNVPMSMVGTGWLEIVSKHCQELIETMATGGGHVLSLGTGPDTGRAESIHVMVCVPP